MKSKLHANTDNNSNHKRSKSVDLQTLQEALDNVSPRIPITPSKTHKSPRKRKHRSKPPVKGVGEASVSIDMLAEGLVSVRNAENKIEAQNQEMEFEQENFWRTCCGSIIDKRVMTYSVQVMVSMTTMAFCMIKILSSEEQDCTGEDTTVWVSLLSAIVGAYIPTTSIIESKK